MALKFNEYKGDDADISSTRIKSCNILIAGLTGSGKSSIIKAIISSDPENPVETKMSIHPVTRNLTMYADNKITNPLNKSEEYLINLFDTVGLGDNKVDIPTILRQIVDTTQKDLAKIHKVVFCFKMDRLRARMSEELNVLYNFFKMVGAKAENFVLCLTFCDILNDTTIGAFWEELKKSNDLPMVREVESVTYTSFPNMKECDQNPSLIEYLQKKTRTSRRRVFDDIIQKHADPFYPHQAMLKMPTVTFDELCRTLKEYRTKRAWLWPFSHRNEEEQIFEKVKRLRLSTAAAEAGYTGTARRASKIPSTNSEN